MPLLWLEAGSRRTAFLVPFVFYLAVSRGIVPGACVFFGDGSIIRAFALWILSAAALAVPWGLLWGDTLPKRAFGAIAAIAVTIPPPLGLIGWGNPLTAAGVFFPGAGWFGLALMFMSYIGAALSRGWRRGIVAAALIIACLSPNFPVPSKVFAGGMNILGLDTSFGRMASGSGDFDAQYGRERKVFQYIYESGGILEGADIVVLPETIIGRMNPSTVKRWTRFFEPFARRGVIFIAGGEFPACRGRKYDNVMVAFEEGGKLQTALQRFPVPFSMYRPFSGEGANAYPSSSGEVSIMKIREKKLGFLVCYEQFLTWPVLSLLWEKPDVLAAPSNLWWCGETSLPDIRAGAMAMWAGLFRIPLVMAANR
jgi:hypothetical protein